MSLEIMQLKMNNIADTLDRRAREVKKEYIQTTLGSHQAYTTACCMNMYEDIANIIREEMKITHY